MSGDKQLLTFMLRYMKYLHDTLRVRSLSAEDAMHTADTMEAGILLYNITGQKAILSVLMMLVSQGADYTSLFHAFPYRTPISRSFTAQELLDALAHEDESGYTHHLLRSASGANLCEGLRVSALCGVLTGSGKHLSAPEAGLARLNKAHGAAGGGVTADPLLGGTHPSRGVSAVSACELAGVAGNPARLSGRRIRRRSAGNPDVQHHRRGILSGWTRRSADAAGQSGDALPRGAFPAVRRGRRAFQP